MSDITCCCRVQYETYNSSRKLASGEYRFEHGETCMNKASYVDKDGDFWCWRHAKIQRFIDEWGPFVKIEDAIIEPTQGSV